jgi:hypothetical protein
MKKTRNIVLPLVLAGVCVVAVLFLPARFRLQSESPSGDFFVWGLKFQGRNAHAQDGTLRLFVSNDQLEIKQQTSIPWGWGLAIKWKESEQGEVFVIKKNGRELIEFLILGSALQCTKGAAYLAPDPYQKTPQNKAAHRTG